jgi:hypothetical protein
MADNCTYHIDLVSKAKFDVSTLDNIRKSIVRIIIDPEVRSLFVNCLDINESNRLEIYCESESGKNISGDDLVEILEAVEGIVGGFIDGSRVELRIEIPLLERVWVKEGYDWELTHEETDTYLNESYEDWEDPDWND